MSATLCSALGVHSLLGSPFANEEQRYREDKWPPQGHGVGGSEMLAPLPPSQPTWSTLLAVNLQPQILSLILLLHVTWPPNKS